MEPVDLERAIEVVRLRKAVKVGLQLPEGLKRSAWDLARRIEEETGAEVIVSGDPCYGACDLDLTLLEEVDLLVHVGHAPLGEGFEEEYKKVICLEAEWDVGLAEVAKLAAPVLKAGGDLEGEVRRVGLVTTVQHIPRLCEAREVLEEHGLKVVVGDPCERTRYPGQVLGCCYAPARSEDVDVYLFIGTGQFHPLGVALATKKRVVAADPVTGEVREVDPEPMLRRRFWTITRAAGAEKIAVLASKKPGQRRMELARRMMDLGKASGREMILVYLDNLEPDRLVNLGVNAAVSTACPRVALDDSAKYRIPVLTPQEFEIALQRRRWEDYEFDEIL